MSILNTIWKLHEELIRFLRNLIVEGKLHALPIGKFIRLACIFPVIIFFLLQGCSRKENNFYIENAALQLQEKHSEYLAVFRKRGTFKLKDTDEWFVITGHKTISGDGRLISFRERITHDRFSMDSTNYRYITIYIPLKLIKHREIKLEDQKGIVFFVSNGNLGFPGSTGCYGYAKDGLITHEAKPSRLYVEIEARVYLISNSLWEEDKAKCVPVTIKKTLTLYPGTIVEANRDCCKDL